MTQTNEETCEELIEVDTKLYLKEFYEQFEDIYDIYTV